MLVKAEGTFPVSWVRRFCVELAGSPHVSEFPITVQRHTVKLEIKEETIFEELSKTFES